MEPRMLFDGVRFAFGYGETGQRIELVEHGCELCGYDRMVRTTRVNPEESDRVEYECNNPICPDYHDRDYSRMVA